MATHYIQKFTSATDFAAASPEQNSAFPIGAIVDVEGNTGLSLITTKTGATFASAAQFNQYLSKITLTPTTAFTAANGLNAIRGEINISSGKTMTSGYVAGVYGRCNAVGATISGTSLAAVYAKADYSGATLSGGHIAPLMANIVNVPSTGSVLDLIYVESAHGTHINSFFNGFGAVNYAFDLSEVSAGTIVTATAGSSASLNLRVRLNGTAYKIALLADS